MTALPYQTGPRFKRFVARSVAVVAMIGIAQGAFAQTAPSDAAPTNPPVLSEAGFDGLHVMRGTPNYAPTKLGRLHYWDMGTGPTLILLHQGPLFGVEFAKTQPLLAAMGFRVLAVDIPGFGFSERPDHAATGAEYADSLAELLDHLDIEQAALAGSHTGATIALAFAVHQPKRISCLVLGSVPVYSSEEFADRVNAPPADTRIYGDGRQVQAWWNNITSKYDMSAASPEIMQWLLIGTLLSGNVPWYGESTGKTFVSRAFDSASAIPKVKVPTMVLSSSGDTHLAASVKRTLAMRPDFAHVEFTGPPSITSFDEPKLWADTVGNFVAGRCVKPQATER